jgi:serine/threonine protein kinase/WD40 repeat protein
VRTLAAGTRLGAYRIDGLLGEGGMGAVYRATDERLGRSVAVKVLAKLADDAAVERFRREARAAAGVKHRNVLVVHEASFEGGSPFLVFELAPGGSLSNRIRTGGRLPWREAARTLAQVARGLEAIHGAGLVHRDLKPSNVLFDEEGVARISDFGLARATVGEANRLTATGELVGTPEFMAPEQVESAREVGPKADLWSLGATLHAALTGRPPFEGRGPSLLYQVLTAAPARVTDAAPDVAPRLERLVLALLQKDPKKRPESAGDVARELEAIEREAGGPRRASVPLALGAAAAVVLLAGAALSASSKPPGGAAGSTTPRASPGRPSPALAPAPPPIERQGLPPFVSIESAKGLVRGVSLWGSYARKAPGAITVAVFARGGIATASYDGTVMLWDEATGLEKRALSLGFEAHAGALAPDGVHLAIGGAEGQVVVVDLEAWTVERRGNHGSSYVDACAWARGGALLTAGNDGRVLRWDGGRATPRARWDWPVNQLAVLGDEGARFVAAVDPLYGSDYDHTPAFLAVGDVDGTAPPESLPVSGVGIFTTLAVSRDGRRILTSRGRTYDPARTEHHATLLSLEGDAWRERPVAVSQDVRLLAFAGDRTFVALESKFDDYLFIEKVELDRPPPSPPVVLGYAGTIDRLALSPDGDRALASVESRFEVLSLGEAPRRAEESSPLERALGIRGLAASPDGARAVVGASDGRAWLCDAATGAARAELVDAGSDRVLDRAHARPVLAAATSPQGKLFATGATEGTVKVWDESGSLRKRSSVDVAIVAGMATDIPTSLAFSGSGDDLFVGTLGSGRVAELELARNPGLVQGSCVFFRPELRSTVIGLAMLGADEVAAVTTADVQTWRVSSQSLGQPVSSPPSRSTTAASAGFDHLLAGLFDGRVALWTHHEWEPSEQRHAGAVEALGCSPDGKVAVSWARDGFKVWSVRDRRALDEIVYAASGVTDPVLRIAVGPEGKWFLAGTERGVVLRFDLRREGH